MIEAKGKKYRCEIDFTVNMIRGKWKVDIIYSLKYNSVMRYGELKRAIPRITHKILAQQLSELEYFGIVSKKVYPEVPPKVEYHLTESGLKLSELFDSLSVWADNHISLLNSATQPK